jgi:hypothetical protein
LVYPLFPVSDYLSKNVSCRDAFTFDLAPDEIGDLCYGQCFTCLFISPGQVLAFDPSDKGSDRSPEKFNNGSIDKLMSIINTQLGDDFAALVNEPTKAIIDRCVRLGLRDTQVQAPTKTSIGLWGIED